MIFSKSCQTKSEIWDTGKGKKGVAKVSYWKIVNKSRKLTLKEEFILTMMKLDLVCCLLRVFQIVLEFLLQHPISSPSWRHCLKLLVPLFSRCDQTFRTPNLMRLDILLIALKFSLKGLLIWMWQPKRWVILNTTTQANDQLSIRDVWKIFIHETWK